MTDLRAQFICIGIMFSFGFFAAWLWDAEEVLRRSLKRRKVLAGIVDFLSCFLLAILFWRILVLYNDGLFRNYAVLGCFLGLILYRKLLHRWGEVFWQKIGHLLGRIFSLGRKFYRLGKGLWVKTKRKIILPKVQAEKYSQEIAEEDVNSI